MLTMTLNAMTARIVDVRRLDANETPILLDGSAIRPLLEPERQRPGNRQNLHTAKNPNLRHTPDPANLEV